MKKLVIGILGVGVMVLCLVMPAWASGSGAIKWEKPVPMAARIAGQGPVEVIPPEYDDYSVKLSGKKGMLTGYQLPEGWKEATKGVKKLVCTNSGGLKHDPATVLNAKVFEKMTGIRLDIIEMKDPLLWPKTLSVAMARSKDVDIFYSTRSMLEIPHLSAAKWIYPVDALWTSEANKLYPEKLLETIKGIDGKYYGAPFCLWGMHLFYRPSWLEAAGVEVPNTWQELVVASKKVGDWAAKNKGPGHSGMVYGASDKDQIHQLWSMVTFSQGKTIVNKDGKVVIDPAAWEMLCDQWVKGGMSKEALEYQWVDAPEVFAKGKAGFIITGGVYMKNFSKPDFGTGIQGDWDVTLLPAWEGVGKKGLAVAGNDAWMINPFIPKEKIAAAMLWLDYQRSFQAQFNELYVEGNESVMMSVYDHPAVKKDVAKTDLRVATVAGQIGEKYPPGMMEVLEIFKEYLHNVALGQLDSKEAYQKAQKEINAIQ